MGVLIAIVSGFVSGGISMSLYRTIQNMVRPHHVLDTCSCRSILAVIHCSVVYIG